MKQDRLVQNPSLLPDGEGRRAAGAAARRAIARAFLWLMLGLGVGGMAAPLSAAPSVAPAPSPAAPRLEMASVLQAPPAPRRPQMRQVAQSCEVFGTARAPKDPWLALRTEPSTRSGVRLRVMYDGTPVQVLDRSGEWLRVRALDDGREGWAHGAYIRCPSDAAPPQSAERCEVFGTARAPKDPWLALRSAPTTQYGTRLRVMYDGTPLAVLERNGAWFLVRALDDGAEGWAHGAYIRCW